MDVLRAEMASLKLHHEANLASKKSSLTTTSLPVMTHVVQASPIVNITFKEDPEIISVPEEGNTSLTNYGLNNTAERLVCTKINIQTNNKTTHWNRTGCFNLPKGRRV